MHQLQRWSGARQEWVTMGTLALCIAKLWFNDICKDRPYISFQIIDTSDNDRVVASRMVAGTIKINCVYDEAF